MGATINIFRRKLGDVRNNLSPLPPCHLSVNCVHPPGFLCSQKSLHLLGSGPFTTALFQPNTETVTIFTHLPKSSWNPNWVTFRRSQRMFLVHSNPNGRKDIIQFLREKNDLQNVEASSVQTYELKWAEYVSTSILIAPMKLVLWSSRRIVW